MLGNIRVEARRAINAVACFWFYRWAIQGPRRCFPVDTLIFKVEDTRETVREHFRIAIRREREHVHLVERFFFQPIKRAAFWCAGALAAMHHGRFNAYAAYALLSLLIVLIVFLLLQTS